MRRHLRIALSQEVVARSLKVGVVVGTLLTLINHGEAILAGNWTWEVVLKILLTYCVPYGVSTYASVSSILAQQDST